MHISYFSKKVLIFLRQSTKHANFGVGGAVPPKAWIHSRTQALFIALSHAHFRFLRSRASYPIDRYQNATSRAISLHELKKVQLQERYTLVTQDSIGHLKTLCMSVLSLAVAFESKWKRYSSLQSDKKMLAFEYEFSFNCRRIFKFHTSKSEITRMEFSHFHPR